MTVLLAVQRIKMTLRTRNFSPKLVKAHPGSNFKPFISIHIPVCNEPPEMVIDTIKSCVAQQYSNFEIIVLCNNTVNEQLWHPIAQFCKQYEKKIIFRHYAKLEGYKAGALDVCRQLTNGLAEYIFTVDADYELEPGALRTAVGYLKSGKSQLLQFPQSYRKQLALRNNALQEELYSYFQLFSTMGNRQAAALPTGTLSLVNIAALDQVGGWQAHSITEDAELGVKFIHAGYKTSFIPHVIGNGLLPHAIADLTKQRSRWVFGNFQTFYAGLKSGDLFKKSALSIGLQLTAWLNLMAFPLVILIFKALLLSINETQPGFLTYLAVFCIGVYLVEQFILLGIATSFVKKRWFDAFLVRIALAPIGAFGWLSVLISLKRPFVCTNKFNKQVKLREIPLFLPLLFLILGIACLAQDYVVGYLFIALHVLFAMASLILYKQFKHIPNMRSAQLQNI